MKEDFEAQMIDDLTENGFRYYKTLKNPELELWHRGDVGFISVKRGKCSYEYYRKVLEKAGI